MTATQKFSHSVRVFIGDVAEGFFEITHNGFALLGLAVMFAVLTLSIRPEIRQAGEVHLMGWLQSRQDAAMGFMSVNNVSDRNTVGSNTQNIPKQQAAVAFWISKKYGVAPEPISALVAEAYEVGAKARLEPTLILAIMAIESGFNPFAQSPVGAQGLMQVMTKVHSDKYQTFGGKLAAFDPVSNLRVGVKVLQECIARAGTLEGGLKSYVGAANMEDDGGYTAKVLAEHNRLLQVVAGRSVPVNTPQVIPVSQPPKPQDQNEKVASLEAS